MRATLARLVRHGSANRGFWIFLGIASVLACVLSSYFLVKGKAFAFIDTGADTFFCFYPLQVAVARQLQTLHSITWSFNLNLGGFMGMLVDPLWLITGWLPDSWQLSLRLPMFVLRLLVGGGFFYGFLRQAGFRAPVAIIGGLGYAFSSYGLVNAQWEVMHGTEFMQFAAFLFLMEVYLRSRNMWAAIAAGAVVGLGHAIGVYMFALLGVLCACLRLYLTRKGERKSRTLAFVAFAAWSVLGLAITAPLLFPALYYFFESPRVSGGWSQLNGLTSSLLSMNDWPTVVSEIAGLVGKDLLGITAHYVGWNNYFEGPSFYTGLLPFLCIPQLIGPHADRREKAAVLISVATVILYFTFPALRYAVYGFGHIAFRFSTLWVSVLLLVLGLAGLQRALTSGWWGPGVAIGLALILSIVILVMNAMPAGVNFDHAIKVLAFSLLYAAFALLADTTAIPVRSATFLLVAVCAAELLTFAIPAVVGRDAVGIDGSNSVGRYDDNTRQALAAIRQFDYTGEFFRVEKTYSSVFLDDALIQEYDGTASYYHHSASITRFVDKMGLPRLNVSPNYVSPMTPRPQVLDLVAVKYVLTRNRSLDGAAGMTFVQKAGDVDIYRNNDAHGFATLYDSIGSETQADALPVAERDAYLLKSIVVEHPEYVEGRLADLRTASTLPDLKRQANIRKLQDDELYGQVETPSAAPLLLSMPFDRGWSAQLDGRDLELFRADYGLTAALIPAGRHTLALHYVPPGRRLGLALMAGAVTFMSVFGLFAVASRRRSGAPDKARREDLPVGNFGARTGS